MEEKKLNIMEELLENLSFEDLADLKIEVDELATRLDDVIAECSEALIS